MNDAQFCACLGNYNCGAVAARDSAGHEQRVYCGECTGTQNCVAGALGTGVGTCGGKNPLDYPWLVQKTNMLLALALSDNTSVNYNYCQNVHDGHGYYVGPYQSGTGDGNFILVAACYNDRKPTNELTKYWNALVSIDDTYRGTGTPQGSTVTLDAIGNFCADVNTAAADADGLFDACVDAYGEATFTAPALVIASQRGLQGALTTSYLFFLEYSMGDTAAGGLPGVRALAQKADTDYGPGLPTDFTGKAWEESRWLGFLIREATVAFSGNATWKGDLDPNATWEAARRLHTGTSNTPESATDLSMNYDIVSAYKAGSATSVTPCWTAPPLVSTGDTQLTVYVIGLNKSGSATNQTYWVATSTTTGGYMACPTNPTP
jgi:hypothetical protein